jgi:phosphoglycolate phosphatase-like HAD superfamily hydrolase
MLVLLFDIDGTLINTGGAGGAALRKAFCSEFAIDDPAEVPFAGRTDRGISSNLFREHDIEDSEENWYRLRVGYLERLPFQLSARDGRVLSGVGELLERLQTRAQLAIGLLTGNTAEGARIKLSHYGLYEHFAFGGYGDDHHDRDQVAHEALAEASRHLDDDSGSLRAWVIGDTPLDVRCARAIGASVLAVATGVHSAGELAEAEPDVLLEDLADTQRVLDVLS